MQALIETTRTAIERRDWPAVNAILQRLLSKERDLDPQTGDEVVDLVLKSLRDGDFQQGWEIAKLLPQLGPRAIAPLIALLQAETTALETRWSIVRILREFDDPACVLALDQLVRESADEDLATMAAEALASIGRSAIESLRFLLDDPASRRIAVQALSRVGHPEAIDPLLAVVNDESPIVRAMAIEALSGFHDERIGTVIRRALGDPAPEPRRQAVIALGYLALHYPGEDFVATIGPLLHDLDREVCQSTALTLGRIGTAGASRVLFSGLQSPLTPEDLKLVIVRALGWIEVAEASDYLSAGLGEQNERICREIITVLARRESPENRQHAAQILRRFYGERPSIAGRTGIRQSLAVAFGELGDPDGRSILLVLATDHEPIVRLHALSALKKLDRAIAR